MTAPLLLPRREVEALTSMSCSMIYRAMERNEFPRPVRIGPSAVRWRRDDIMAWIESRPEAAPE